MYDSVLLSNGSASCTEVQGIVLFADEGHITLVDMDNKQVTIHKITAKTKKHLYLLVWKN